MPTQETLECFIARVEENAHTEAIEEFYTENSTMQENQAAPRQGRAGNVERESQVMARAKTVKSTCVRPALINGDHVAIRWIFEFEWLDGSTMRMEEIAWQRWEGEKIAQETFFYDPGQRTQKKA